MVEPVKFLLVDDVPENLHALQAVLRQDGLELHTAASGPEALELLLVHEFALALIDVQMPGMNGFELAELMRGASRTRRVPIILLTAGTDEQRLFKGYEAGAVDYLVKPFNPHILRRKTEVFLQLDQQRRELQRQRDEIEASERRFRRSLDLAPAPMLLCDETGRVLTANAEWLGQAALGREDVPNLAAWARLACPDAAAPVLERLGTVLSGEAERVRVETELHPRGAPPRTWNLVAGAVGTSADGRRLVLCVAHDITERAEAERTRRLLVGELNHRVKNTLATVMAIGQQTLRQSRDPDRFAQSFSGRLLALSQAHSLLSAETWQGAELRDILREQLALGAVEEARVEAEGPPVRLEPQTALHAALILHELFTNAVKYGALSVPAGRVALRWEAAGDHVVLRWAEGGGPPVQPPAHRGFGSALIERTARAGGGDARVRFEPDGVRWEVSLPIAAGAASVRPLRPRPAPPPERPPAVTGNLGGMCFLLVEDEPLVAMEVTAALQEAGGTIAASASTHEEALRLASLPHGFDAALLDANLRGRPVGEVAAALRLRGVPFIFVSGYGPESLPAGFETVPLLAKPFTTAQLLEAAGRLALRVERVA
ncbi:response regulator [Sabulicella glaciei]|uniref:histidine kinase n=1 Tax=Sabulicella glaciei TaxID=2984948 RepID=A0ABT3NUX2_9PROT|nr:response regulator [Roseococcus sp. MDT2-1-1]MCW8085955.1 response regulator [Roseococcus sp. MDT2-1-1]